MTAADPIDAARLGLLLGELRLPAIKHIWSRFAERADKEGWPAGRFLIALVLLCHKCSSGSLAAGTSFEAP